MRRDWEKTGGRETEEDEIEEMIAGFDLSRSQAPSRKRKPTRRHQLAARRFFSCSFLFFSFFSFFPPLLSAFICVHPC
jgi:hypothetical protein